MQFKQNFDFFSQSMQSYNPAVSHKRKERDITKLLMSNFKVNQNDENPFNFQVEIQGPSESLYAGGSWTLNVLLPDQYPYKSPSIGFVNKIFHPNVDEASGSVCLDVINQAWSPMYDLINVFETFIPQLLSYPNPNDPLNPEAAAMMIKDRERYDKKVKDMVDKYAKKNPQTPIKLIQNIESIKLQSASTQNSSSNKEIEEEDLISNISLGDVSELSSHSFDHGDIMKEF